MRRLRLAALPLLVLLVASLVVQAAECQGLSACVQAMRTVAQSNDAYFGVGPDASRLAERVLAYEGAVDALIPLLKDPDKRVADLAAYALANAPEIDPAYLPQIREGLDRDLGWLAPTLARIGTDEAAKEAVDRYLVSDSAPGNQEAYAVKLLGRSAIPFILDRARCLTSCRDDTHYLLSAVLGRMGPERAAAGPELLRLASDRDAPPQVAQGALRMIASLGADGLVLEAGLLRERETAPYLSPWIDRALVGIGSSQAGAIFAGRLAGKRDVATLRELADVGLAGRDAGPAVVEILEHEPELRAAAATTLGFIDYAKATPALVAALDDSVDARVVWAAARALGRLGAKDALPALDRTAEQHWYAPVRDAAREAATQVRSGVRASEGERDDNFATSFFAFLSIGSDLPECRPRYEFERESTDTKLYADTARGRLEQLAYQTEVVSYGAADEEEQRKAGAEVIEVHPGNLMEHRSSIEQVPGVALRVDDGWLVGGDRGEWGGELGFVGDDGHFQQILDDNVEDIHRLGDRIVATTGLAHLGLNRGSVVALTRLPDGRWQATTWRKLPGAATRSSIGARGLVVALVRGGAVGIDADGAMRMADCPR